MTASAGIKINDDGFTHERKFSRDFSSPPHFFSAFIVKVKLIFFYQRSGVVVGGGVKCFSETVEINLVEFHLDLSGIKSISVAWI